MASDFDFLLVVDRLDGDHLAFVEADLHENLFVRSAGDRFAVYRALCGEITKFSRLRISKRPNYMRALEFVWVGDWRV